MVGDPGAPVVGAPAVCAVERCRALLQAPGCGGSCLCSCLLSWPGWLDLGKVGRTSPLGLALMCALGWHGGALACGCFGACSQAFLSAVGFQNWAWLRLVGEPRLVSCLGLWPWAGSRLVWVRVRASIGCLTCLSSGSSTC